VAGWGRDDSVDSKSLPDALQQLLIPVHDADTCSDAWGRTYKEDEMICAGTIEGTSSTCGGDSGGPLSCQEDDGTWTLYGATSFTAGTGSCDHTEKPPVFTRVSSYVDWINRQAGAMTSLR